MYHPDPRSFGKESQELAPIGGIVVSLSRLELAHDELIAAIFKKSKKFSLAISGTFPRQFKAKTDFVVEALLRYPPLREIPLFDDGYLNILWLQYQLDELYDIRSALAHGAIHFSEHRDHHLVWHLERVVKGKQKGEWDRVVTKFGSGFLADAAHTSKIIEGYFGNLKLSIESEFSFEANYQDDKVIKRNHDMLLELHKAGIFPDPFASFAS